VYPRFPVVARVGFVYSGLLYVGVGYIPDESGMKDPVLYEPEEVTPVYGEREYPPNEPVPPSAPVDVPDCGRVDHAGVPVITPLVDTEGRLVPWDRLNWVEGSWTGCPLRGNCVDGNWTGCWGVSNWKGAEDVIGVDVVPRGEYVA
jgi:hypothetical protein